MCKLLHCAQVKAQKYK